MTNKKPGREKPPGLIIILGKSAFADLIERTAVSKMLFCAFVQPPNSSSMVNNFSFGNAFSYFSPPQRRADGSSFRGNFLTFWRVEIFQVGFRHLFSTFFSTTLSTTDTVGSARIDSLGVTISNLSFPSSFAASRASFSQAISTSPIPRSTKVLVEPRAPESRTSTFLYSARIKSCAFA